MNSLKPHRLHHHVNDHSQYERYGSAFRPALSSSLLLSESNSTTIPYREVIQLGIAHAVANSRNHCDQRLPGVKRNLAGPESRLARPSAKLSGDKLAHTAFASSLLISWASSFHPFRPAQRLDLECISGGSWNGRSTVIGLWSEIGSGRQLFRSLIVLAK